MKTIVISAVVVMVFAAGAFAEEKSCPCVADTYVQLSEGVPWTVEQAGMACEGLYPGSNRNIITDGNKSHNQNGDIRDALLKFDLTGVSGNISSATLKMFCNLERYTNAVGTLTAHPMLVRWVEMEADWKMRSAKEPWLGGSIESNGNFEVETAATKINPGNANWRRQHVELDVTALVKRWVNGGLANNGLVLMSASDSGRGKRMDWCAREGNPHRRHQWPQLIVDFESSAAPATVVRTAPPAPIPPPPPVAPPPLALPPPPLPDAGVKIPSPPAPPLPPLPIL